MADKRAEIWDAAKEYAAQRNVNVRKQNKRQRTESALSGPVAFMKLLMLLMTIYALFKYVPAYVNFNKIIAEATDKNIGYSGAQNIAEDRGKWGAMAPLRDYAKLKKAYVKGGQTLQVQYILPKDAQATLTIKRCKNIPFFEVFKCQVAQEETFNISGDSVGTRRIFIPDTAMYHLESKVLVNSDERFDIVWRRT